MMTLLQPFLYADKLMDVGDIAEEAGKAQGGWYPAAQEAAVVDGKWNRDSVRQHRPADGLADRLVRRGRRQEFPATWDEFYEVGKKLKANGHPYGLELGHGFGDNHGWIYPLLWSYGGHEVEADGKTVVIDSDETAHALDYARKLFQDCDARGLPRLDRRQQQQGVDGRADLVHQQRREHPLVRQGQIPGHRQSHRSGAESARPEGPLPSAELPQPRRLQLHSRWDRRRTIS